MLRERKATICDAWMQALTKVSLCDRTLLETKSMVERLEISQSKLKTTRTKELLGRVWQVWLGRVWLGRVWQAAGDAAAGLTGARPRRRLSSRLKLQAIQPGKMAREQREV